MTDKGYDSDANRVAALARGITPVIPRRENSKQRGRFFPKRIYKLRARIEQTIGKLKRFKRVAMRCEKTDISYSAIISFACGLMLVKSVHTKLGFPHFRRRGIESPRVDLARLREFRCFRSPTGTSKNLVATIKRGARRQSRR